MNFREDIKEKGENIFSEDNFSEQKRLQAQQSLLYNFDMGVFSSYLSKDRVINILDLGCNNGETSLAIFRNFKIGRAQLFLVGPFLSGLSNDFNTANDFTAESIYAILALRRNKWARR